MSDRKIRFFFHTVWTYLYTGSPPPFLYQMTKMGGCDSLGAVVLQGNTPIPPRTAVDWYRGTTSPDDSAKKGWYLKFNWKFTLWGGKVTALCYQVHSFDVLPPTFALNCVLKNVLKCTEKYRILFWSGTTPKCGTFMIFLPLRFYVKSIFRILKVQILPFC